MTVRELINGLIEFDPDMEVVIYNSGYDVVEELSDCYLDEDAVTLETGQLV